VTTYLLAWNPKKYSWGSLEEELMQVRHEGSLPGAWSVGNNKSIQPGDRVFLIRLGVEPRGIVGSGLAMSSPYSAGHWDPSLAAHGATTNYIDFVLDTLREQPPLPMEALRQPGLQGFHWSIQMSGVSIPEPVAAALEEAWSAVTGGTGVGFPDQAATETEFAEGAAAQVYVNKYERSSVARSKCLEHFGRSCCVCGMSFAERYGASAALFIQVHHLVPLSEIHAEYVVDPVEDLRPICPNCHAFLHLSKPPMPIDLARAALADAEGHT